ncbi:hypothetical protein RLOC_00012582 [Lonchura striata]|uniref:Uncharacterized protein n=1 Tax=Lonchura striata TaxID=40157 RepID=A0A218V287_9PASE|nr:hypothetical protein RLOC_00012582 [Lonchura striata domestica]
MSNRRQITGQSSQVPLSDFPVKLSERLIEAHPVEESWQRWCLSWVLVGVVERSEQRVVGHGCLGCIADVNEACLVSPLSCSRPQQHSPGTALAS